MNLDALLTVLAHWLPWVLGALVLSVLVPIALFMLWFAIITITTFWK